MINVIQTATRGNRTYQLANTPLGRVVFFEFGDGEYTQYRNLTQGDILWSIKPTAEFRKIYAAKPIEVFASKRLTGFSRNKIVVNCGGDGVYWLAEKKKPDGYLYEIPATDLRLYPKKDYPDKVFVYTRYHIASIRDLDYLTLERLKTEEVMRFNGGFKHSVSAVSSIVDAVYKYIKEAAKI
jgi:hypothetical protein